MKKNQKVKKALETMGLYKEGKASIDEAWIAASEICLDVVDYLSKHYFRTLPKEIIYDIAEDYLIKLAKNSFFDFQVQKSNFKTFFCFAVKNLIKNYLKNYSKIDSFENNFSITLTMNQPCPIDYKNIIANIRHILDNIEWTVFEMKFVSGLKVEQIAYLLKTTIEYVRNQIRKITRKLRKNPTIRRYYREIVFT